MGAEWLTKVLETLRQEEFIALNSTKFQVTFSAGVAQYPEDGTDCSLCIGLQTQHSIRQS